MRKRRLKSLGDIRKYLAYVLNEYENGQADETKVKTVAYCCNILSGVIKDSEIESRLAALEQQMQEQPGRFRHAA